MNWFPLLVYLSIGWSLAFSAGHDLVAKGCEGPTAVEMAVAATMWLPMKAGYMLDHGFREPEEPKCKK